jgi:hypothetical protein
MNYLKCPQSRNPYKMYLRVRSFEDDLEQNILSAQSMETVDKKDGDEGR